MQRLALVMSLIVAGLLGRLAAEDQPKTTLKTEHFDRDPAWEAVNNRVKVEKPIPVIQDFGYNATNHAGGKAVGERGGSASRVFLDDLTYPVAPQK